jgi:hypothetical protein
MERFYSNYDDSEDWEAIEDKYINKSMSDEEMEEYYWTALNAEPVTMSVIGRTFKEWDLVHTEATQDDWLDTLLWIRRLS